MINLREQAIKSTNSRFERLKLKCGFTDIPNYACSSIADYEQNKHSIRKLKTIIFPRLTYLTLSREDRSQMQFRDTTIRLKDSSGEIEAQLRMTMFDPETNELLCDRLHKLYSGGELYHVEFRNGLYLPEANGFDPSLYLISFKTKQTKKYEPSLRESIEILLGIIAPKPALVPIRSYY